MLCQIDAGSNGQPAFDNPLRRTNHRVRHPVLKRRQPARARSLIAREEPQAEGKAAASLAFTVPGPAVFWGFGLVAAAQTAFKKLFRRRRVRRRAARSMQSNGAARFSVATFNIRGIMDRWRERQPVLRRCLEEMDADVVCFQECLTGEYGQDRALLGASYHVFPCKAALFNLLDSPGIWRWYACTVNAALGLPPLQKLMVRLPVPVESMRERYRLDGAFFRGLRDLTLAPFFGNSCACRLADAHEINHSTLVLGDWRAAQRIEFELGDDGGEDCRRAGGGGGGHAPSLPVAVGSANPGAAGGQRYKVRYKVWVVNVHLDHAHPDNRHRQAMAVADWMGEVRGEAAAVVLCGDFNAAPEEPFHRALRALGYRSGHRECHGREPAGTYPTGIQAPFIDGGPLQCIDYCYVWAADGHHVRVVDASVHGHTPEDGDKTLYPSDHAAVKISLELRRIDDPVGAAALDEQPRRERNGSGS